MLNKMMLLVSGVLAMVLTGGCTVLDEKEPGNSSTIVVKSPADDRDYRYLTLENGLKVLLISDPDTDKEAAAVDVNVGSFKDPDHRLGLAHFLEHMLFMGTEKYPDVESYGEFIRANGGNTNAYTTDLRTNYYFDINSGHLEQGLDRLAQFFVSPKLDPVYVDRERNAVDSEYKLHAREDSWRLSTASDALSNPEHPKSRFTIGSLETLSSDGGKLWQDLKSFYDRYYLASNMGLVVYGKEPLDTLESWVNNSFSAVRKGRKPDVSIGKKPYGDSELGVRINLVPLKDTRVLSLKFPMESVFPYYRKKPLNYLARVIGYEGKGSLHSLLKEQGLIDSLGAYNMDLPNEYSEFIIRMELTRDGLERVDEITALVFDYLDLVRREGIQQRLFNESKRVGELDFRFQEDRNPQQTVSRLASQMHVLPPENLLNVHYLFETYDPQLIRRLMNEMTPENMRQIVIAKNLPTDQIEPYFNTHFSIQPLPPGLVSRLNQPVSHKYLTIPAANEFITTDLELRSSDEKIEPLVILERDGLKVWNLTDTSFGMPRASIRVMLSTPMASSVPENNVNLQLYRSLLSRSLNEYGYPAKEAGLNYGISAGRRGLMLSLAGYQDKQLLLLEDILKAIESFKPDQEAFEQEKALLVRRLKNKAFLPPYRLALDAVNQITYTGYPSDQMLLKEAEASSFEGLIRYAREFYSKINVEMFVYGNHSRRETLALAGVVEKTLLNDVNRGPRFDESFHLLAETDRVFEMEIKHDDSVFVSYYQLPQTTNRERAIYAVLARLLSTPFYSSLRTEQQLGYAVFAGARPVEKHPGVMFVVQSPVLDPVGIEQRVDVFLGEQVQRFKGLSEDELDQYREGLIGDLMTKDANMDERAARFWQGISTRELDFDNYVKIAEEARRITVRDIQIGLDTLLKNRGKLVVRSVGDSHQHAIEKDSMEKDSKRKICKSIECFDNLPLNE